MGGTWNVSRGTNARVWGAMGDAIVIAAICAIMVIWLANSWLPHKSHKLIYKIYNVAQRTSLLLVQLKCYV